MTPRAPVLFWDVLEEHLDEAEFLWAQWERGLVAHDLTLDELASGAERRLLAHLDGLIIAGPPAAERLLLPAIAGADPERASAAASALLAGPVAGLDAVADALTRAPVERRAPLLRALALAERPEIDRASPAGSAPTILRCARPRSPPSPFAEASPAAPSGRSAETTRPSSSAPASSRRAARALAPSSSSRARPSRRPHPLCATRRSSPA
jgi:hypothetical protein